MLELTQNLAKNYFKLDFDVRRILLKIIAREGGLDDARALLPIFLNAPFEFENIQILPALERFSELADEIFAAIKDKINEPQNSCFDALTILARWKFEPIKPVLARYAFGENGGYHLCKDACLGLLEFDCARFEREIEAALRGHFMQPLFPEFLPALVCKLPNREEWLPRLYEWGCYCSTDCNAGLLMGLSLCGKSGEELFKKALFNEFWECSSGGTGTLFYAYEGLKNLAVSLGSLADEIFASDDELRYKTGLLLALGGRLIHDGDESGGECLKLYAALKRNDAHGRIRGLGEDSEPLSEKLYDLDERLLERIDRYAGKLGRKAKFDEFFIC